MGQVVSFDGYTPPPRFDDLPWTEVRIEEAAASTGPWTQIDTVTLSPVDSDPSAPAARSFTTQDGTGPGLWYRIIFADADGDVTEPTSAVLNAETAITPFATVDELARILTIRNPSSEQRQALLSVLFGVALEISSEVDLASTDALTPAELDICRRVNLDRAADIWRHSPADTGAAFEDIASAMPTRYSWERYAQRLAPIKRQWGLA